MTGTAIRSWEPTGEEERAFQATDGTFQWLCNLSAEERRRYAGKWIAAKDSQIVALSDTFDALLHRLAGTDLQTVVIDRIEGPAWTVYR